MKAIVCKEHGLPDKLVLDTLPDPVPGKGEAVVAIKAASLNFPDVLIIQNKYQVKPPLPFVPGAELAGVVTAVGEGVRNVKIGDRVFGTPGQGAFAEACAMPAAKLVPMPPSMSFETAAAFMLTYGTSHHALRHLAATKPGETLLVLGAAGGVGLAAVEIGKILGLKVIACASSAEKLEACRAHGADGLINYASEDLRIRIKELTADKGVDVVYDAVGGPYAEPAIRALAWRGRYLVIGFAAGDIPKVPLNLLLLQERSAIGVFWGAWTQKGPESVADAFKELAGWFEAGKLKPHVSKAYALADTPKALEAMMRREVVGKVVVTP